MKQEHSNCCNAPLIDETDLCSQCKERCGPIKHITLDYNLFEIFSHKDSSWKTVHHDGKFVAHCMNEETARQVIYKEAHNLNIKCEFLCDEDFTELTR